MKVKEREGKEKNIKREYVFQLNSVKFCNEKKYFSFQNRFRITSSEFKTS